VDLLPAAGGRHLGAVGPGLQGIQADVGIGTVVYAACIGPLAHIFVPLFSRKSANITGEGERKSLDPAAVS
jgi:uncharacterized membrane protein YczE